jgi:uncharacterized membrane protein
MEAYAVEWLELVFRWLHLLAGIAWIGASFHFVMVDNALQPPELDEEKAELKGHFWAIHGGGVYRFSKYHLAPERWPGKLHWSKWEAYTTWLTGTALMVLVYYYQSQMYLIGKGKWLQEPDLAVATSVAFVIVGVGIYEGLIRSSLRRFPLLFALIMAMLVLLLSWLAVQIFADRAAFIHVGAVLGSIMVGNVFFGIIPAQRQFVSAVQAGKEPDQTIADAAKQRSFFNNYFTLPVLFCMISNHYPFIYGHSLSWLALFLIMLAGAIGRHYFNRRHVGENRYEYLIVAILLVIGVAFALMHREAKMITAEPLQGATTILSTDNIEDGHILNLLQLHCAGCHASEPITAGIVSAPGGLLFETLEQFSEQRRTAFIAITTGYMPLGNLTGLSSQGRQSLLQWLSQQRQENDS